MLKTVVLADVEIGDVTMEGGSLKSMWGRSVVDTATKNRRVKADYSL